LYFGVKGTPQTLTIGGFREGSVAINAAANSDSRRGRHPP
jgi:hypothetical protein